MADETKTIDEILAMQRPMPEVRAVAKKYLLVPLPLEGFIDENEHRPAGDGWRLTNTTARMMSSGPVVALEWTRFIEVHRRAN